MTATSQTDYDARERWLPLVSELAQVYGWRHGGDHLERLTDQIVDLLKDVAVNTPGQAVAVITNYYHDAATVALLQGDWGEASVTMWAAVLEAARRTPCTELIGESTWGEVQQRIASRLRRELHRHTYQSSLRLVIAHVVTEELIATTTAR
jgi:hypothetical protein